MIVSVISIDDYKAIKVPSSVLEILDSPKQLELSIENDKMILQSKKELRKDWGQYFKIEDELYIDDNIDIEKLDEI